MKTRSKRGFTFVEISIVLLVLVLAALIIAPRSTLMVDSQRVESFRLGTERIFRSAVSQAASRREDLEMSWDDGLVLSTASETSTSSSDEEEADEDGGAQEVERLESPNGLVTFQRGFVNGEEVTEQDWVLPFSASGRGESGGAEFSASERLFWVKVDAQGRVSSGSGELTNDGDTEWEAGELERRVNGTQP